jgi:signal transduction histidine kinase
VIAQAKPNSPCRHPNLSSLGLALSEQAPLPMAAVEGVSHIVRYANPAFRLLLNKSPEQLVGRPFREIMPAKDECLTLLDRVFQTGVPESHTEQRPARPLPVFCSYAMWPVLAGGRPMGVIIQVTETAEFYEKTLAMNEALMLGSVRQHELNEVSEKLNAQLHVEITERKRAEHELVVAKDEIGHHAQHLESTVIERTRQLRETICELEAFSYSISHDMRAPLRAMQSYAQFVVDEYGGKLDEQGVNYLQQIMRSAVRLDHLIQDVLSYNRVVHLKVPMAPVNLDRLVRDIVEAFPNGHPIKPEFQIRGTLPTVMGNEALLGQCVSNLFSNGAKFVSPGTIPRLTVSAEPFDTDSVRVWFTDNGIGIAPENHERIFRLFERIHPTTVYEGTGIGLTIVRKASERMDAKLGFESELGKGSKFWIQLKKG